MIIKDEVIERRVVNRANDYGRKRGYEIDEAISNVINNDLQRLYKIYQEALAEVELSFEEAIIIIEANQPSYYEIKPIVFKASLSDAIHLDTADVRHQIDGKSFLEKVKRLTDVQCYALMYASECFWTEDNNDLGEEEIKEIFQIKA